LQSSLIANYKHSYKSLAFSRDGATKLMSRLPGNRQRRLVSNSNTVVHALFNSVKLKIVDTRVRENALAVEEGEEGEEGEEDSEQE
jgi:hypothetical protein